MADKDKKTFINATLAGIADDAVQRFGSAIKEHLVALNGIDRDIDMSKLSVGKTVLLKCTFNHEKICYKRATY